MTRQLFIAPSAQNDLVDIISYIERRTSEKTSDRVLRNFQRVFTTLQYSPHFGHQRKDVRNKSLRFYRIYSYVIAYRHDEARVEVVRIIQGSRDFSTVFGDASRD
ncbi:MAG TPA: type II toxin-antitoxin system RelE/ParE family toxin [Tepidisphaeraceae bacterium]|nr:type II toxin-antitoxin system RelE/ParE family toxin [Tepidisphaeraceae bacterium]